MGSFNGLIQAEFTPPKTWVLSRELSFRTDEISSEDIEILQTIGANCSASGEIFAESGFHTDLASVPRSLWFLISPWDIARSAVIHDHLYACCRNYFNSESCDPEIWKRARAISDKIFLLAMYASEPPVPSWKKKAAYYSVRAFGKKPASQAVILQKDQSS